jgi:hypothetical protein
MEYDNMLINVRVAQAHFLLETQRFDFSDRVLEEMRLMPAVILVR